MSHHHHTPAESGDSDLEQFVHRELRRLPDLKAPPSLIGDVLRRIEERDRLPWWRRSVWHWPDPLRRAAIGLFAVLALALMVGIPWLWRLYGQVPEPFAQWDGIWMQGATTWTTLTGFWGVWVRSPWLWLAVAVMAFAYASMIGIGACLFRVCPRSERRHMSAA